jgi:hypothetical protein
MQCPPDFPAVSAMVALSSVIGRKACIAPKRRDNWRVIPNLWGAVVGRPGVMKSPALAEAMKPLDRLQAVASDLHAEAMRDYSIKQKLEGMGGKATEDTAQKLVKAGKLEEAKHLLTEAADFEAARPPALRRYVVTDASVEALGEILIENPWGVLAYRDELNGLLRGLDKEGRKARGTSTYKATTETRDIPSTASDVGGICTFPPSACPCWAASSRASCKPTSMMHYQAARQTTACCNASGCWSGRTWAGVAQRGSLPGHRRQECRLRNLPAPRRHAAGH